MKWAAKAFLSLIAITGLLVASSASAGEFSINGGYFSPWKGGTSDAGWLVGARLLTSDPGSNWRFGAEFEYRNYEQTILGVNNVELQDVLVDGLVQYVFFPDKITPYVGLGGGLGLTIIDRLKVQNNTPLFTNYAINKVGVMLGVVAILGAEVPIGTHLAAYVETRGSIWARLENDMGQTTFRNTSGWDARAGFKVKF